MTTVWLERDHAGWGGGGSQEFPKVSQESPKHPRGIWGAREAFREGGMLPFFSDLFLRGKALLFDATLRSTAPMCQTPDGLIELERET